MDEARIIERFRMQPHPTCGWFTQTFRSERELPRGALGPPFESERPCGTALYFLVTAQAHTVLHRIRSDQIYHHYFGAPLEVLLLREGGAEIRTVGPYVDEGMEPQLLVPAHTFHVSRVRPGGRYAFLGTTAWPGVAPPDMELGDVDALADRYPDHETVIRSFGQPGLTAPLEAFR